METKITKLEPCQHVWKKTGTCKTCKVPKLKWVCQKCGKIWVGTNGSIPRDRRR